MRSSLICTRLPGSTSSRSWTSPDAEKVENETRVFSGPVVVEKMQVSVGSPEASPDRSSFRVDGTTLRLLAGMVGRLDEMRSGSFHRSANSVLSSLADSHAQEASLDA